MKYDEVRIRIWHGKDNWYWLAQAVEGNTWKPVGSGKADGYDGVAREIQFVVPMFVRKGMGKPSPDWIKRIEDYGNEVLDQVLKFESLIEEILRWGHAQADLLAIMEQIRIAKGALTDALTDLAFVRTEES